MDRLPRLVATDLDGTLLDRDGNVTPRTLRTLGQLEAGGVGVVFVTGRPVRWMDALWEHVGDHGIAICSNGGIVYDVAEHRVLTARAIEREVGLEVADRVRAVLPGSVFALERIGGFAKEPGYSPSPADAERTDLIVGSLPDVYGDDVVKLLALDGGDADPAAYWSAVEESVGHLVTTTWSARGALVEMSAVGVSKASTLAQWCQAHGIAAAEVVAFGDMPNDIAMLDWAGLSFAMENAHHLVKQVADGVAPSNDEDGVARVLEQLFDL
ncbi:MAG: HAD family phosphatase [Nocardioidaceae bacterium]|nr:MAG: HAD family phosphatase [Nocardioidaceae bacterium]